MRSRRGTRLGIESESGFRADTGLSLKRDGSYRFALSSVRRARLGYLGEAALVFVPETDSCHGTALRCGRTGNLFVQAAPLEWHSRSFAPSSLF